MAADWRAFAIDLDGTLLVGENLPQDNIDALREASRAGVRVLIATARWRAIAGRIADQLGVQDPIIACSGAQVFDPTSATDLFDQRLPDDFTRALFDICNRERCIATATFNDAVRVKLDGQPDPAKLAPEMAWVPALELDPADPPRIVAVQGSACVQAIREDLAPAWTERVNIFDSIGPTGRIIITITAREATKGAALDAACRHLGLTRAQVVAFGDAENDLEMFRAAGASVAMGQAEPAIQQAATWVTRPNHEAGVAHAVRALLADGRL